MKKKCAYAWFLVAALMITACSSDQSEEVGGASAKTGTFEIAINFADPGDGGTRASTAIPTTSWANIQQIQFFLYNTAGNIAWSAIETPATGTTIPAGKQYVYATVPAAAYTLVAVANAQSATDAVATYISGAAIPWLVANVHNRDVANFDIRHKAGAWSSLITGTPAALAALGGLAPYAEPSEVFMGSTPVTISSTTPGVAVVNLTREVSLMRVRIDQSDAAATNIDFGNAGAGVLLYNLPNQMGIRAGNAGGIGTAVTSTNALSVSGAYSTTAAGYLDANYTVWKDVVVFPNNGGRANNANTNATAAQKYFIVVCGVAKAGHMYSGGAAATAGDPVFWYGQIDKVFTPNTIREVNVVLITGGSPAPPPTVVEYGALDITVNTPQPWGSIVVTDPIEM